VWITHRRRATVRRASRRASIGTNLTNADIPKFEKVIKDILGADTVKVTSRATNSEGESITYFDCTGNPGHIAMTRIKSRSTTPFCLMWKDDAKDNGYLEPKNVEEQEEEDDDE
jgi:hypothetical protein